MGAYASYFNRGFSTDLAFKAEFYSLNLAFTDLLGVMYTPSSFFPPTTVPFSGSGSTQLNDYTVAGNVNYQVPDGHSHLGRADRRLRIYDFALRRRR
jgi:hypothetical protein